MKRIMLAFIVVLIPMGVYASCPTDWEEIPIENFTISNATGACPVGTRSYYHISAQCDANVF